MAYMKRLFLLTLSTLAIITGVLLFNGSNPDRITDFYWFEFDGANIPIFVRGSSSSETVILFVQGGPGSTAIDFARADYPLWKESVEKEVLIAYYDQRGLNQAVSSIDSSKITFEQYAKDILAIANNLKERYQRKVVLMGHSYGAIQTIYTMSNYPNEAAIDASILLSPPLTTDFQPEIGNTFRLEYLKNIATEKISKNVNPEYWSDALEWSKKRTTLATIEEIRQWNRYADSAFEPTQRSFWPHTYIKVAFSSPYYLFEFFRNEDDEKVADLIWKDSENIAPFKLSQHLKKPTLAVTGRFDDLAPPEELFELASINPIIEISVIEDAGHEPFLDQPETFDRLVLNFLAANGFTK
jgi:pimeloyl-ACP methyl ester carboxylesterase